MRQLQTEAGGEQAEERGRRPGLRRAGDRIGGRAAARAAVEAAEELRQAPQLLVRGGVEEAVEHLRDRRLQAIAGEADAAMSALSCGQTEPL